GLGKVIFWMLYTPGDEWIKKYEEEALRKKKEDEQIRKNKELENFRKQESERIKLDEEKKKKEVDDAKYVKGVVKFSNISVRNLPKMDIGGKADPFVLFRMGDSEKQTSIVKSVLNYDYIDEEYEVIYDPSKMKGQGIVDVEVYDYDTIGGNDIIGINSVDILPSMNKEIKVELFLQPKKSKKDFESSKSIILQEEPDQGLGKVIFSMLYTPDLEFIQKNKEIQLRNQRRAEELRQQEQENQMKNSDNQYVKGNVNFSNIQVQNLPMMDFNGKSDPFVLLRLGNEEKKTSTALGTLNYQYKNESFDFTYDPAVTQERKVEIEVYDYDNEIGNDFIGTANMDV
ncbi:MAG: hypothetical protein EZS28_023045, partial [Streblomastix strix]